MDTIRLWVPNGFMWNILFNLRRCLFIQKKNNLMAPEPGFEHSQLKGDYD